MSEQRVYTARITVSIPDGVDIGETAMVGILSDTLNGYWGSYGIDVEAHVDPYVPPAPKRRRTKRT